MCAQRRYRKRRGTRIQSPENVAKWVGGKAEYDSDAIDKMKLKRETCWSRACLLGGIAPRRGQMGVELVYCV